MSFINNNIIISLIFLLIMVFIINRETFNLTNNKKIKISEIDESDDELNNYSPPIQNEGVNLSPLFYTACSIEPKVLLNNNNKNKEISITKDIIKPIGNFVIDKLKNPPKLNKTFVIDPEPLFNPQPNITNAVENLFSYELN